MGGTEALSAMKNLDLEETSLYKTLLQNFQFHAGNLRQVTKKTTKQTVIY